jgi:6,7-dimethyl-8-ribityllumazine synthase
MAQIGNSTLLHSIEGIQQIQDAFVILVKTEWNAAIVDELERGCMGILKSHSIQTKTLVVPGAVEIPLLSGSAQPIATLLPLLLLWVV